jgi:hypothetical protein
MVAAGDEVLGNEYPMLEHLPTDKIFQAMLKAYRGEE